MKLIPLTKGMFAKVDDEYYDLLMKVRWYATKWGDGYYAITHGGYKQMVSMHRYLMCATKGQQVDHKDGDGLNNQLSNIRLCTPSQNMANRKSRTGSSSQYLGVSYYKKTGKWEASIRKNGITEKLGYFTIEEDAGLAYNEAAKRLHGEFARLNVIMEEKKTA